MTDIKYIKQGENRKEFFSIFILRNGIDGIALNDEDLNKKAPNLFIRKLEA